MYNLGGDTETYRGVGIQKPTEGGGQEKHRVGVTETQRGGTTETQKCEGHTDRHTHTHAERGGAHLSSPEKKIFAKRKTTFKMRNNQKKSYMAKFKYLFFH